MPGLTSEIVEMWKHESIPEKYRVMMLSQLPELIHVSDPELVLIPVLVLYHMLISCLFTVKIAFDITGWNRRVV